VELPVQPAAVRVPVTAPCGPVATTLLIVPCVTETVRGCSHGTVPSEPGWRMTLWPANTATGAGAATVPDRPDATAVGGA
jgi:hypothetical protein